MFQPQALCAPAQSASQHVLWSAFLSTSPSPWQASGEGFVAAGRALQDAQAQVSRKFAGQPHLEYLLEAAAAGLVQGAAAGLQKVRI